MPTYFTRHYTRKAERVGRTEKSLGVLILLLLAGIVAIYAYQASTNSEYLFSVDPSVQGRTEEPREMLVAGQLLPPLGDAAWQMLGEPEAFRADAAAAWPDAARDLENFGAQWVYRARYQTTDPPDQSLTVTVCDLTSPAQAFGLWRARQPAESEGLNLARGGWITPDALRAAFWSGRYYSELRAPAPLVGTMTLPLAAGVIAAAQLDFGGPFAAEKMLPPQGRVADSFRYVHRDALGAEGLDEAFLVDLAGDITAWVTDAKTAAGAGRLLQQLESAAPLQDELTATNHEPPPSGSDQLELHQDGPLTVLPWGDGFMALFAAGKYVHGAYGPASAGVVATAKSAYALAGPERGGLAEAHVAEDDSDITENPFPDPGLEGWQRPGEISRYTPDTLYIKIDGRAGLYLQFHVVGLTFGTYRHQADNTRTIDVYWYDMGQAANALGVYRAEAAPEATPLPFGQQGYQTGGAVFFIKSAAYVQVLPGSTDQADAAAAMEIARRIAELIEDGGESLWAAAILPQAGHVDGSIDFITEDVFGLDFLHDVFTARYELDEGDFTLFVHRAEDAAAAQALFEEYLRAFEEYGKIVWQGPDANRLMAAGDTAGMIDVVFVKGRYLAGVAGADDVEPARKVAARFYDGMDPQ